MRQLTVFNNVTLDGYIADARSDMSWAHQSPTDDEWNAFVSGNAQGGGALMFGRVTYDLMAAFWPTPAAMAAMPGVAAGMNRMPKYVFSRTMDTAAWQNTPDSPVSAKMANSWLKSPPIGPVSARIGIAFNPIREKIRK